MQKNLSLILVNSSMLESYLSFQLNFYTWKQISTIKVWSRLLLCGKYTQVKCSRVNRNPRGWEFGMSDA